MAEYVINKKSTARYMMEDGSIESIYHSEKYMKTFGHTDDATTYLDDMNFDHSEFEILEINE